MGGELWVLEEGDDLICQLALRRRKRNRSRSRAKALAHILLDHRTADRTELVEAVPVGAGACPHGLELVVAYGHWRWKLPTSTAGATGRT